jgi:hypothetical protein
LLLSKLIQKKIIKHISNSISAKAKIRYNVPISFAFEDKNHLSVQSEIDDLFRFNISPKWTLQAGPLL